MLLYTGGVKSWSIVSALQDLGMKVVATGTKKSTEEDKARIRELMGDGRQMIDDGSPQGAAHRPTRNTGADILIAGGRNLYTALKARIPFLDINQEREFGYAGYAGMLELARQLALTIESPVWAAVRKPAPWAAATAAVPAEPCWRPEEAAPWLKSSNRKKGAGGQSAQGQPAVGASLAFLGLAAAMPHAARLAGLHGLRQGLLRAPLPRADPAADHGDGSGVDASWAPTRTSSRACDADLREEQAGPHRPADHRPVGNPGHRHPRAWCASSAQRIREFAARRRGAGEYAGLHRLPGIAASRWRSRRIIETLVPESRAAPARRRRKQVNVLASARC